MNENRNPAALPLAAASLRLRKKPGRPRKPRPDPPPPLPPLAAPEGRLLDLKATARYLSVSPDTVRGLWWSGTLPRVRIPTRTGELRRLLFDRVDLDRLIERWKDPTSSIR
jgi:hypothetical protein